MANGKGSCELPKDQASYIAALGATRQDESFCTLGNKAPRLALPASRLRCCSSGIRRATIHSAIRAPCGKDGSMKRAARHKTGSVVFDTRRKTWNFLRWEEGKRRSKQIGTLAEYPTKGAAWRAAQLFNPSKDTPKTTTASIPTVRLVAERYCTERMPSRYSTARVYRSWLNNYVLPQWGDKPISEVQPRPVELWLRQLQLAPKSKSHVRNLLHVLVDFAMWAGVLEVSRNPIDLVVVKGATKRTRQPRSLTVEQFQKLSQHLREPFGTMAMVCVCFGLRISECLALRWSDVDWLNGTLRVERGIVGQRVDDVKTVGSRKSLTIAKELLGCLKVWRQTTEFASAEDWIFASPLKLGRLPYSYPGFWRELQRAATEAKTGHSHFPAYVP
jgi:integrase